jgi:hypothetical protein
VRRSRLASAHTVNSLKKSHPLPVHPSSIAVRMRLTPRRVAPRVRAVRTGILVP